MKKSYVLVIILFSSLIITATAFAQDESFDEKIKQMAQDNSEFRIREERSQTRRCNREDYQGILVKCP